MKQTHIFHADGMHCQACLSLIESELENLPEINKVKASLRDQQVVIIGDFGDKKPEHIATDLNSILKPHGYTLSLEKRAHRARWSELKIAAPAAVAIIAIFIILQKLGVINLIASDEVTYGAAFLIGLIASVSTCLAVVGGLVLSLSASFAKQGDRWRPQLFFHFGRLTSFFFLGGAIGAAGASFQLSNAGALILNLIIAAVLIILGVNLLDLFPQLKKFQPTLPAFLGRRVHNLKNLNHTLTPLLVGLATFFLPCGFTQSMQLYTLTTGDFLTGALTMFIFALGTLPVLAVLSFSSLAIHRKTSSGIFFKTAGLVVIFFGAVNLLNSLAVAGLLPPLFNF